MNFSKITVLVLMTVIIPFNLAFAQQVDPEERAEQLKQQNFYIDTIQLCSQVNSIESFMGENGRLVARSWQGIKDVFGGNPFLPSKKTSELLHSEGYWHALEDCFGDSTTKQMAFSLSIIAADRFGYFATTALTVYLSSAFIASKYILAFRTSYPKLFFTVATLALGTAVTSMIISIVEDSKEMFAERKLKKHATQYIKKARVEMDQFSKEDLDAAHQLVIDKLKEVNDELSRGVSDPDHKKDLLRRKHNLEARLAERK